MGDESPLKTLNPMLSPRSKRSRQSGSLREGIRFVNDDDAEKRQRKLEKALQLTTPRNHERRRSGGLTSGLTQKEMSEHYSNCIKLSSENKINAKNAFGLHLIDVMQKMLKDKNSVIDMTNFQVASCTLDASAKIYAGRVDSVHAEAFKILGGLGSGRQRDGGEEAHGQEEQEPVTKRSTRKVMPSSTVEQNLKNLNISNFDLEFDVDPLFRKAAAELDEGGTESLLIHTLPISDVTCELLLDSNLLSEDLIIPENGALACGCVNAQEIAEWSSRIDWRSLHVCPSLSEFEFTETGNLGNKGVLPMAVDGDRTLMAPPVHNEYSYVVPETMDEACGYDNDCFGLDNGFGDDQVGVDDDFQIHGNTRIGPVGDTSMTCHPNDQLMSVASQHTVDSLQLTDALQPSEYSYFNMDLISMWAGPTHWKIKRPLKKADDQDKKSLTDKKKSRGQKKVFSIDFTAQVDFGKAFRKTKASTMMSRAQLTKQEKTSYLLPDDCHYETNNLFKTFLRLSVLVRRQSTQKHQSQDKEDDWYDYNNPNDSINYCPDVEVGGGCEDDIGFSQDHTVVAAAAADLTMRPPSGLSQDHSCFKGLSMTCNTMGEQSYFLQENMVALPHKVQKFNINFSKTTRKMDIKRLKSSMWNLITGNTVPRGQDKENQPANREDDSSDVSKAKRRCITSFSGLYRELPEHISTSMTENLSVHISLICLLHLANEHGLQLKSSDKMDEVIVIQPTTPEE